MGDDHQSVEITKGHHQACSSLLTLYSVRLAQNGSLQAGWHMLAYGKAYHYLLLLLSRFSRVQLCVVP